ASHPELGDLHPRLLDRLDDTSTEVRASAARSLGVLRYGAALSELESHLTSESADERLASLRAIARIDSSYAAGLDLAGLRDDEDPRVAREASRVESLR